VSDLKPDRQRRDLHKSNLSVTSRKIGLVYIKPEGEMQATSVKVGASVDLRCAQRLARRQRTGSRGGHGNRWFLPNTISLIHVKTSFLEEETVSSFFTLSLR
jgi:hypothetical protein